MGELKDIRWESFYLYITFEDNKSVKTPQLPCSTELAKDQWMSFVSALNSFIEKGAKIISIRFHKADESDAFYCLDEVPDLAKFMTTNYLEKSIQ